MFNLFFPLKNKNSNEVHIGLLVCSKFRSIALFSLTDLAPRWHHLPNNFGIRLKPRNLNQKTNKTSNWSFHLKMLLCCWTNSIYRVKIVLRYTWHLYLRTQMHQKFTFKPEFSRKLFMKIHENWFKTVQVIPKAFFPAVYLRVEPPYTE